MGKNSKLSQVNETNLGVYIWQMPNGSFLVDEDMNFLSITAMRDDITAMARITEAAKNLGYGDGRPIFAEGRMKINDEEYEEQVQRLEDGEIPDPYDIGIYKEGLRKKQ
jgi:hypothetical protein